MQFDAKSTLGAALAAALSLRPSRVKGTEQVSAVGTNAALQIVPVTFAFEHQDDLEVATVVAASGVKAVLAASAYTVFKEPTRDTAAGLYTGLAVAEPSCTLIARSVIVTDAVAVTSSIVITHKPKGRTAIEAASGISELLASLGSVVEAKIGEYTGTQAAADIDCGFDPKVVIVINLTDGDTIGIAINSATNGTKSHSIVLAAAQIASAGILFGTAGQNKFSLGNSSVLNETSKLFQYLALGW